MQTLVIHTTSFDPAGVHAERDEAAKLGRDLYELLTRPSADALAWGAGIPVRVATLPDRIDVGRATLTVVVPVLGHPSFANQTTRHKALQAMSHWRDGGALVLPLLLHANWRSLEPLPVAALLTDLYASGDTRRASQDEILAAIARRLAGEARGFHLFISHAKADLADTEAAAEKIRAHVVNERSVLAFFDRVSILPGEDLGAQIDGGIDRSVFIAVRGDRYSSRTWCRRELLKAKQLGVPTLTVEVLSAGEARSAAYLGNGPSVVWHRESPAAASRVVTMALVEAVRHLHFMQEAERIVEAVGLPPAAVKLSRPPELLDIPRVRSWPDSTIVVIHPDPPLPSFERMVLEEADKRIELLTPVTAFSGRQKSGIQSPLDGWQIGLSVSESADAPLHGAGIDGTIHEHVQDVTTFLGRTLISVGASLAYGGDFRLGGFTRVLAPLVVSFNETANRSGEMLHSYIAAFFDPYAAEDIVNTVHSMRGESGCLLPALDSYDEIPPHRRALYLSDMRRCMTRKIRARVLIGGSTHKYLGRYPGVIEEAWWSLQHPQESTARRGQPLYVVGGFGGASGVVAKLLKDESFALPPELDERFKVGDQWDDLVEGFARDPDVARLGVPSNRMELLDAVREMGRKLLSSDERSLAWNGLSVEENYRLLDTTDLVEVSHLVVTGLTRKAADEAQGMLRVELVEGDVSEAADLDLIAFATFDDIAPSGVVDAIDRVTGGAGSEAHRTRKLQTSRGGEGGPALVLSASLGAANEAAQDPAAAVARAAKTLVEVARQHRLARIGVVTFLGSVAADLTNVVAAITRQLSRLRGTLAQVAWYERDRNRCALVAAALAEEERAGRIVLTQRVASATSPPAEAEPQARRTILAVRHPKNHLDVALILPRSNGLAPSHQIELSRAGRELLTEANGDRPPRGVELEALGGRVAQLVLGHDAEAVQREIRGTELVVAHDSEASAVPFEALRWVDEGREVVPALEGGVVRRLLARVATGSGVARPPHDGRLRILVVANPLGDLGGADVEARGVLRELAQRPEDFEVSVLRHGEATKRAVRGMLKKRAVDVLHYAGHAFFDGPGAKRSGLELADGQLTLAELRALDTLPRFVFANACHSARVRRVPTHALAQSFAELFLRGGVDAYLGTFWLVSDDSAARFASEVYRELLDGLPLGAAVVKGRQSLHASKHEDWVNYVLYGDTDFRLVRSRHPRSISAKPRGQKHEFSPRGADARLDRETSAGTTVPPTSATSAQVDGNRVVASWVFDARASPETFFVVALEMDGAPCRPTEPIRIERREAWEDTVRVVIWSAVLSLGAPLERTIRLSPSEGEPIDVGGRGYRKSRAEAYPAGLERDDPWAPDEILVLLSQQTEEGERELLRALHRSADPVQLKGWIQAQAGLTTAIYSEPIRRKEPKVDARELDNFLRTHGIESISTEDVASTKYQTREDWFSYVNAPGAIGYTLGKRVVAPRWRSVDIRELTLDVRSGDIKDDTFEFAVFADNANGLYASNEVIRRITEAQLPYVFYLGDVYYSGAQSEIRQFYSQLKPMMADSELMMLAGNHELFSGGQGYHDLLDRKTAEYPNRQRQRAEMFRVRGPGFQILGIDTMFVGWDTGRLRLRDRADEAVRDRLRSWLADAPDDFTILMTANEPWDRGSTRFTPLYRSLVDVIAGRVDLWFWGNVHYGALFSPFSFAERHGAMRPMTGVCVGHGGYPFYTQKPRGVLPEGVACEWVETETRFWPEERIRPDMGANGWCKVCLKVLQGKELVHQVTFVDWVGRTRYVSPNLSIA